MLKKLLLAGLMVSASASAWAQSGQLGANQIWGNPTASGAPSKPSNVGSFLTNGTGVTITGTPKATIGLASQLTAAGPMGSATQTPVITYNAQGQLTLVTLATIAPPFSAVTGSLACSQQPAFTGDTTSPAGSCVNSTVKVNGVAFGTSPSTDTVPVITASNTATYTALPNCVSGGLQYTTSTHLFSCGAAGTGNVSNSGTPTSGQFALFTSATVIQGVSPATKSDQQTGTSATAAVTPSQQQQHDSAAKSWVTFTPSTAAILASYNVSGVVRNSIGNYTVSFTTAFASANYVCQTTPNGTVIASVVAKTTTTVNVQAFTTTPASADPSVFMDVVCYGRQ